MDAHRGPGTKREAERDASWPVGLLLGFGIG